MLIFRIIHKLIAKEEQYIRDLDVVESVRLIFKQDELFLILTDILPGIYPWSTARRPPYHAP
jgi:hypothetical protein